MTKKDLNLLTKIIYEAKAYNSFEDIEKLVEVGSDLSMIPIQPLYISLINTSADQVANILHKLSKDQRQALRDIDLWHKDVVDVKNFEYWIDVYAKCNESEVVHDFVSSEDFLLYIKSRVNIHTFDVEDPMYPDHDYYFLTDDSLLLIEYGEDYNFFSELKYLIRVLYDKMGVEKAYAHLFKLVNDSFSLLQENQYSMKKERLRDYGFVDYYDALQSLHPFASLNQVSRFVKEKKQATGMIHIESQNQSLHSSALVSFDSEMENILSELALVKDEKRVTFLHFTFLRLINSTITLNNALRGGRVELTRVGKYTKLVLELGLQYAKDNLGNPENSIFEKFDFLDVYKIGHSLISIGKNKIKKALKNSIFENESSEYFLGAWWNQFIENSFAELPKMRAFSAGLHPKTIDSLPVFNNWMRGIEGFTQMVPFVSQFYDALEKLKVDNQLNDHFYLNMKVSEIDFEAILLSSFINLSLGNYESSSEKKMGITIGELLKFIKSISSEKDGESIIHLFESEQIQTMLNEFSKTFGFEAVMNFNEYLYGILCEHLSGYDFSSLDEDDFRHVGGPIILNVS